VQARQDRLGHPRGVVDGRFAADRAGQDPFHPLAHAGGVAVARQVDHARQKATVVVAAHEQLDLATALHVQHRLSGVGQLLDRGLKQLVARIGLEEVHQRLAAMAPRRVLERGEDPGGLAAQHRDPRDALGVGGRREQADEATLAEDLAVRAEGFDAHVVEVDRPVDGGPGVGLGDDQQLLLAGLPLHRRR